MSMGSSERRPSWEALTGLARRQSGLFTTAQAHEAGYSRALLTHHVQGGRFTHVSRGIYRVAEFPFDEQEELVALWLSTGMTAVFSHETALQLHGLSDALPARIHMTIPPSRRRRRLPDVAAPVFADVPTEQRTWIGAVPVTNVPRTLIDCARSGVQRDFVSAAVAQALQRGLVTESELMEVRRDLAGQ